MYKYKLNIFQSNKDFQHYWNITSTINGKIIVASSEGFSSRQNAKNNLLLVWNSITKEEIDTSDFKN